jgi:hypothetical protein
VSIKTAPPNDLGCTHTGEWSSDDPNLPLAEQLRQAGVALELPPLAGF